MILRGTGLNFGNDPFATVEEGGGIRMKRNKRRRGLDDRMKRSGRRRGEIGARDRLGTGDEGAEGRGPINRRALSQSRKTAKLHLPF